MEIKSIFFCSDEKVLMIGSGPSGVDVTSIVATKAEKVVFSTHDHSAQIFPTNVVTKPDVAEIKTNSVVFTDGSEENITAIIYCTGMKLEFIFQPTTFFIPSRFIFFQAINIRIHF